MDCASTCAHAHAVLEALHVYKRDGGAVFLVVLLTSPSLWRGGGRAHRCTISMSTSTPSPVGSYY
eukprot:COSAG01_NODE_55396_length_325_cov_0.911504_1_plen_64_part_01